MTRINLLQLVVSLTLTLCSTMLAADDRYLPLDHRAPAGVAGRWAALTKPGVAGIPQPVQIKLPSTGTVGFYAGSPHNPVLMASPAQAGMGVGYLYRFRISEMPEFPGVELFPTIEIIDRMHAPQDLLQEFPIPVEITIEEVEIALQERLVTKVIYLENPNRAYPEEQQGSIRIEMLKPNENLLQAADQRGRPMAILRLGGRVPDPRHPSDEFFTRSPITLPTP